MSKHLNILATNRLLAHCKIYIDVGDRMRRLDSRWWWEESKKMRFYSMFVLFCSSRCTALCPYKVCPYKTMLCCVASFSLSAIFGDNAASCNVHTINFATAFIYLIIQSIFLVLISLSWKKAVFCLQTEWSMRTAQHRD